MYIHLVGNHIARVTNDCHSVYLISLQVSMSLAEFHTWVRERVRVACEEALMAQEFVPDPIEEEREGTYIHTYIHMHIHTYIHTYTPTDD